MSTQVLGWWVGGVDGWEGELTGGMVGWSGSSETHSDCFGVATASAALALDDDDEASFCAEDDWRPLEAVLLLSESPAFFGFLDRSSE